MNQLSIHPRSLLFVIPEGNLPLPLILLLPLRLTQRLLLR